MAEEDVNNTQVVTEQEDANTEQVVTVQDENAETVTQQGEKDAQNQDVPYSRFKEVNDAKKVAEEQAAYAQRTIDLMNANAQQQQVQPAAPKSTAQQALDSLGITADDLYGENIVRYQETVNKIEGAKTQQNNAAMKTQQFMMATPDLAQVVGSVNPMTGQIIAPTQEVMALVQKKPYLNQASVQGLYQAVIDERQFAEYAKTANVQKEFQIRNGVKTKTEPLGGSAAGGGGAGTQGKQQLMSRDRVREYERKLAAGELIS